MKYKVVILFVCCLLVGVTRAVAQEIEGDSTEVEEAEVEVNKKTIQKMAEWAMIFGLYSDADLSSKVNIGKYADMADLGVTMLTNTELRAAIADFHARTFVNVYPLGMVYGDEWIYQPLNEVTKLQYDVKNAPYLMLNVNFQAVNGGNSYKVTPVFTASGNVSVAFDGVNAAMAAALSETFDSPILAKSRVNTAIIGALGQLEGSLGNTFVPNIALRYKDKLYTDGQNVEIWAQKGGKAAFVAVDKDGKDMPASGITWGDGYRGASTNTREILLDNVQETSLIANGNKGTVRIGVKVKTFTLTVEDLLKQMLVEVITEKIEKTRAGLDSMNAKSAELKTKISQARRELDTRAGLARMTEGALPAGTELRTEYLRAGTAEELQEVKRDRVSKEYIDSYRAKFILAARLLLQVKVEVFLADLIKNDGNLNAYVQAIKDSSPDLVADLIVNMMSRPEERTQLKDVVVGFLNKQIDEVASK